MNWIMIGILLYIMVLVHIEPKQQRVYVEDTDYWTDAMREEDAINRTMYTF